MGWDDGIWDGIWDGMGVGILPFPLIWVASIGRPRWMSSTHLLHFGFFMSRCALMAEYRSTHGKLSETRRCLFRGHLKFFFLVFINAVL